MEVFSSDATERELVQVLAETHTMDGELIGSMNFIDKDHKLESYIIMPASIEQVLHHKLKNIQINFSLSRWFSTQFFQHTCKTLK